MNSYTFAHTNVKYFEGKVHINYRSLTELILISLINIILPLKDSCTLSTFCINTNLISTNMY